MLLTEALETIGARSKVDADIRDKNFRSDARKEYRQCLAKPLVERFFVWVNKLFEAQGLLL